MNHIKPFNDHFNLIIRLTKEKFDQFFNDRKCVSINEKEVEYIRSIVYKVNVSFITVKKGSLYSVIITIMNRF